MTAILFRSVNIASLLRAFAAQSTGGSTGSARAILLEEPPSIDAGEITNNGSINQHAVLKCRVDKVQSLYADPSPATIIAVGDGAL